MRNLQCLGGTQGLREDPVPQSWVQRVRLDQIDASPDQVFEFRLEQAEPEQPDRLSKLDEDIDVAVRSRVATGYRAEERE